MPQRISTDWDKVRVRCTVILVPRPGTVAFDSEAPEIAFDEDLIHFGRASAPLARKMAMLRRPARLSA